MSEINLKLLGTYATGSFNTGSAEILAYDPVTYRLFAVNANTKSVDILNISNPRELALVSTVDLTAIATSENLNLGVANSIAYSNGVLAVAVEAENKQNPGSVLFLDVDGNLLNHVTVGALPDMLRFTPDGTKVLVANEGEPSSYNQEDSVDPEGSVSIIDVSKGVNNATVTEVGFTDFNGRKVELQAKGVRIFGPNATVAEDLEPEYMTITPDSQIAVVTLQENNAAAVIDLNTGTVTDILPLGYKNHNQGQPILTTYDIINRGLITNGGEGLTTATGEKIELGGFSGLWYEGVGENGNLKFLVVPDRGPNGDTTAGSRPFLLPDYQARVVSLELNEGSGEVRITNELFLTRGDGVTPITGLPNIPNFDERAVDASGNAVDLSVLTDIDASKFGTDYDPLGADLEGIIKAPDGTYWMVDEYRPAIYHFDSEGKLLHRFVPEGTTAKANEVNPGAEFAVGTFGDETLPGEYLKRRENRGFEGMALDTDNGILYAFIQTPLSNPNRAAGNGSQMIRMLGINPGTGEPVAEYVYLLQKPSPDVDKIGDAVYAGNGKFYVMERDSSLLSNARKFVFEVNLAGATNILGRSFEESTLELQTADSLSQLGITPVNKVKVLNLPSVGYLPSDKPEGLTYVDGRLAVINDNDFGLVPEADRVQLGLIDLGSNNGIDASDRDNGINIQNYPVYGMYQPDAIKSFTIGEQLYLITANEGDARDYDGFGEEARIKDLTLDATAFPNGADLQKDESLGRLTVSTVDGDIDGDGDYDQLYAYGARSFSIWDALGNLVYDSGDALEKITADAFPEFFNASNDNNSFDNRSDNKGPEPEAVEVGVIGGRTYAFIGLERIGGVVVYDISDPTAPVFQSYTNNRNFSEGLTLADDSSNPAAGDLGPEDIIFIPGANSPNGRNLIAVANEISGSTSLYEVVNTVVDVVDSLTLPIVSGTPTDDTLTLSAEQSGFMVFAGDGNDVIDASQAADVDVLAGDGDDRVMIASASAVSGESGDDILMIGTQGASGGSVVDGGTGADTLLVVEADNSNVLLGAADNDKLQVAEGTAQLLFGGSGVDVLRSSSAGGNRLYGGSGDDELYSTSGDRLFGGVGDDSLYAGTGGANSLWGGEGADNFWLVMAGSLPDGHSSVYDFEPGLDRIGLSGITANQVSLAAQNNNTIIRVDGTDVAMLMGINTSELDVNNSQQFVF